MSGAPWQHPAYACLAALAATWRYEIVGGRYRDHALASGGPIVWTFWHGHLLPLLWLHRHQSLTVLVSRHADGERVIGLAKRWGYRPLRGSSTRGAVVGLLGLARTLQRGGQVAIAVDGPRGPRQRAKAGAMALARRGGAPIVAVAASAAPAWRAASWDGFVVPVPWARVRVAYAPPWRIEATEVGEAVPDLRPLQQRLEWATDRAAC